MASPRTRPQERRRGSRRGQATDSSDATQPHRQTDNWFRRFAEASFEGLVIHEDGVILDANHVAAETVGYARAELVGRHARELIAPESQDSLQRALVSPSDRPIEAVCVRKDGSTFPVEIRGRPISYDGRMVRVASLRDITDRKRVEEALRASERKYREIFEDIRDIVYRIDTNGIIIDVSPSVERYGYSREELIGTRAEDVFEDPEDHTTRLKEVLEKGELLDHEV